MQKDDPSVLAAMDGQELVSDQPAAKSASNKRDEPTVFFFVIFGLVYEALASSTPDADADAQRTSIVSLQALKCLMRRKYCGKVFSDPPLFEELLNLFYRMALTEPSGVQIHLVEAIASLAESIKADNLTLVTRSSSSIACSCMRPDSNGHSPGTADVLSSPLAHCLRICAYILRRVISGPQNGAIREYCELSFIS